MANVLAFVSGHSRRDWTQQELAEFYRVERALIQAGLQVVTDRGMSDEGDPWFVFCRVDDGEVVVHFARINGRYVVAGPAYDGIASGPDIRSIATDLVGRHPLLQRRLPQSDNVILHPSALLVAIVAIALLKSSEVQAHSTDGPLVAAGRIRDASPDAESNRSESVHSAVLDARHVATIISAAMIAMSLAADNLQSAHNEFADLALPADLDSESSTSGSLISASRVADSIDKPALIENISSFDASSVDVTELPSLSGEQTLDLLSLIAVLNDVASPVMADSEDSQVQTISEIFGPAAGQALAVAFASLLEGSETVSAGHAAIIEVEMDAPGALPAVRSLTFVGPDEVSHIAEFEIVSALPENLEPYLAHGLTLEAASSSAGNVFVALNVEPVAEALEAFVQPVVQTPDIVPFTDTVDTDGAFNNAPGADNGVNALDSVVSLERIVDYIENFIANADRLKVIYSDGDAILLDVRAVNQEDPTLRSITWEFADGTSISLIGSGADLPYELVA